MAGIEALRDYRTTNGLTQSELGQKLGVSAETIYRWENGKRAPSLAGLQRIAKKTGISVQKLVAAPESAGAAR